MLLFLLLGGQLQKSIFIILFLLVSVTQAANYTVVSDYDDTIKKTNVASPLDTVLSALFSESVFTGVSEYYSNLKSAELYIVTGTPPFLKENVKNTLRAVKVTNFKLAQKELHEDVVEFKTRVLESLVKQGKGPFVLIGDDTQHDPQIYLDFQKKYPEKVLAIHIRRISNRGVPAGINYFYSTYELAYLEFLARRIEASVVNASAAVVAKNTSGESQFPKYADCPNSVHDIAPIANSAQFIAIRDHLVNLCKAR